MKGFVILCLTTLACVNSINANQFFCLQPENQGRNVWHESDCSRYYRCWLAIPHPLICPSGIAPFFDSCRSACVSNPNAVCGDPGDRCEVIGSTTGSTTPIPGETTSGLVPTAPVVTPTAPTINPPIFRRFNNIF